MRHGGLALFVPLLVLAVLAPHTIAGDAAQSDAPVPGTPPAATIPIHYLGKAYDEPPPLSLMDKVLTDNGVQGARLGIKDDNDTGRFLGQHYELIEDIVPATGDVVATAK